MRQLLQIICLFGFGLSLAENLPAQSEAESSSLVISSQDGKHEHVVKVGDRLPYKTKGGSLERKGRIDSVQDSSVTVAGKEIAFADMEEVILIKGKDRPAGNGLIRHSLIAEVVALLFFALAYWLLRDNVGPSQRFIFGLLIALAFVLFPLLLIFGLLRRAFAGKHYSLGDHWKIRKG